MLDNTHTSDRDRVRQQLISNTVNKHRQDKVGTNMSNVNTASNEMHEKLKEALASTETQDEIIMEEEDEATEDELEIAEKLPNILDLAEQETISFRIFPKVIFSVSYVPENNVAAMANRIKSVRVKDNHYSFYSFMRKGDGSKGNPHGAMRDPLSDFVEYMSEISTNNTLIMGNAAEVEKAINLIREKIENTAMECLYSKFLNEEKRPVISIPLPIDKAEDGSIDIEQERKYEKLDIRRLYELTSWENVLEGNDGSQSISPVFHFNMQFPILYGLNSSDEDEKKIAAKREKIIKSMYNAFRNVARDKHGVEFYFGFIMPVDGLVSEFVRDMIEDVLNVDDEDSPFIVVSDDYIENAIANGADDLGMLPHSKDRKEIKEMIFAHGGSMLMLKAL